MKLNDIKMPYAESRGKRAPPTTSSGHSFPVNPLLQLVVLATSALMVATFKSEPIGASEVSDLKLVPDYRAVKLRWTLKHLGESDRPLAFSISFCELTSWNVEIKCRTKNLKVAAAGERTANVIQFPADKVVQLEPPEGTNYEAHIYDLRALTNYTFHVSAATQNSTGASANELSAAPASSKRRVESKLARRLDAESPRVNGLLPERVETKPFRAEATKCLADASEVLVQTGRYFGGRISVENSPDSRCNLIGNKSSEQSAYLFRIDHEICGSRIMDGTRIETMILVHENKDILTHNTARFLVLCNFSQKSFTLRASISLPRVNGVSGSRAAVITPQSRRPTAQELSGVHVMLGSMPGVYRTNRVAAASQSSESAPQVRPAESVTSGGSGGANSTQQSGDKNGAAPLHSADANSSAERKSSGDARARALTLATRGVDESEAASTSNILSRAPPPVEVQSKVLYVVRGDPLSSRPAMAEVVSATGERLAKLPRGNDNLRSAAAAAGDSADKRSGKQLAAASQPMELASSTGELALDSQQPIVLTNNHRVADGNYRQSVAPRESRLQQQQQPTDADFSIRYATTRVGEIPVGESRQRMRNGRMRSIGEQVDSVARSDSMLNRMGELEYRQRQPQPHEDLSASADSSNETTMVRDLPPPETTNSTSAPPPHVNSPSSLAQNITSYLLKWSLRTLSDFARKSLESMARDHERRDNNASLARPAPASGGAADSTIPKQPLDVDTQRPHLSSRNDSRASPQAKTMSSTSGAHLVAKIEPTTSERPAPATAETLLDGFVTTSSRRRVGDQPAGSVATKQPRPTPRLGNYSRSSDHEAVGRGQQAETTTLAPPTGDRLELESARSSDGRKLSWSGDGDSQTGDGRSSANLLTWFMYGTSLAICVGGLVLWTVWLVFSPPKQRHLRLSEGGLKSAQSPRQPRAGFASGGGINPLVVEPKSGLQFEAVRCESNQCGRQLVNCVSSTPRHVDAYPSPSTVSRHSVSTVTTAARSVSAHSTGSQNDCKDSEFVCTEHILFNHNVNAPNESFA